MTRVIALVWQIADTYFVMAHLHHVLVGANVRSALAAIDDDTEPNHVLDIFSL